MEGQDGQHSCTSKDSDGRGACHAILLGWVTQVSFHSSEPLSSVAAYSPDSVLHEGLGRDIPSTKAGMLKHTRASGSLHKQGTILGESHFASLPASDERYCLQAQSDQNFCAARIRLESLEYPELWSLAVGQTGRPWHLNPKLLALSWPGGHPMNPDIIQQDSNRRCLSVPTSKGKCCGNCCGRS